MAKAFFGSFVVLFLLTALACDDAADAPTTEPTGSLAPELQAKLEAVLAAYEEVRVELANDRIEEALAKAAELKSAEEAAIDGAPPAMAVPLGALLAATSRLRAMDSSQPDEVRRMYGEVSRALVDVVNANPSLKSGRHIFQCPMAQGYGNWIQPSEGISNPYMGQRMLTCGGPTDW